MRGRLKASRFAITERKSTFQKIMALETTLQAVSAILKTDPTVTPKSRSEFLAKLRHDDRPTEPTNHTEKATRIVRRGEAAARLGIGLRTLDKICENGSLAKRVFPNRKHAAGILESDLEAWMRARKTRDSNPQHALTQDERARR